MRTRKHGFANVEEHPKGSEQYRVRARIGDRLVTVASRLDHKTALATADIYGNLREEGELREGITLSQFGEGFLARREQRGLRSLVQDRNRWKQAVERDPIGMIALRSLRRSDVVEWRDRTLGQKLALQTVKNSLNLIRVALAEALDRELVDQNVARDVRVPRAIKAARSFEDLTGVLRPEEQITVINAVPAAYKHLVTFALFTGLRWSEQSWLRWSDVTEDAVTVRLSRGGGPTKGGSAREVPLLPPALDAIAEARRLRKKGCPWVFPSIDGKPRQNRPNRWQQWITVAKIGRRIRWHDLRHTCATALLAGWWGGERWTLQEIAKFLGHEEISTTERYAKKLDETVRAAVRRTFPGGNKNGASGGNDSDATLFLNRRSQVRFLPGAQQKNSQFRGSTPSELGTFRELPRPLKRALKSTSARSREGIQARRLAAAYEAALAGDESRTIRELKRGARGA